MEDLCRLGGNAVVSEDRIYILERKERDHAGLSEFCRLREDDDPFGFLGHDPDSFCPHQIIAHKAILIKSVGAYKKFIDEEIVHAFFHHGAYHYLGFVLVLSS